MDAEVEDMYADLREKLLDIKRDLVSSRLTFLQEKKRDLVQNDGFVKDAHQKKNFVIPFFTFDIPIMLTACGPSSQKIREKCS